MLILIGVLVAVMVMALGVRLTAALTQVVKARQAVVVCNRLTGSARQLSVGPAVLPVLPWVDEVHTIDLTWQLTSFGAANVASQDGLLVSADLDVAWSVDPALLRQADLDQILPFLADLAAPIRRWANYWLRTMLGQYPMNALLRGLRTQVGLERLLRSRLQDSLAVLGVRVHTVRLICQPEATVLSARIAAEARAQELATLAAVLGPQNQLDALIRYQMFETMRRTNPQLITAFELPSGGAHGEGNGHSRLQFVVGAH